ncbi:expressed unknown protein [Ectocarpus siliculosus]|uniref:Uncharacterized protein n=1 Tax=Ectocarpus siliculosus TaxID=2880 RepID=D7FHS4_ECTSI|nr:expressed unknown protein [Ectocarpus siliculosus]|eukprot:CBJ28629.1 expressed unknown protein [Ectocarpus siliculosus]
MVKCASTFSRIPPLFNPDKLVLLLAFSAENMAMLPDDSTLTIAIKDATVSTSTVNPARITSAVQKMRPDWCVNKRRVKRLLRSMNNDAWKAAVNTTVNAGNPSARGSSTTANDNEPPSAEAPGASVTAAAETATTRSSIRAAAKAAKAAKAAEKGGVFARGGGGEEPLSESLDLATDLELEPGVDLKADLGIVTNAPAAAAAAATAVTEVEDGGCGGAGASAVGDSGRAEAADNLGFEMIDKAEVVGSGAGTGANGKTRKPWPWAWTRSS